MAPDVKPPDPATRASFRNTAFISYSHAADGKLAPALQRALHNFAKPWYQLRALRVFRDKTSLAANPALWPTIEAALGDSLWFLYMASPRAAQSHWVQQELSWWLEHRTTDKLLILLTDGELAWDNDGDDFDWGKTTSVPENLRGRFTDEPLYVDLRWARNADNLSLRHSLFRGAILDIAAPLRGKPKEDLDGEDVRQHRKNRAWAWSASVALAALAVTAISFAFYASSQRTEALHQRDAAIGRLYAQQLARVGELADSDPDLARDVLDETIRSAGELREFTWDLYTRLTTPTVFAIGGARNYHDADSRREDASPVFALSHDGSQIATASVREADSPRRAGVKRTSSVLIWDTSTGALLATLPLVDADTQASDARVSAITFSPDGRELAASAGDLRSIVRVWDVASGRELMSEQDSSVRFLGFTSGSAAAGSDARAARQVITAGEFRKATVWSGIGSRVVRRRIEIPYAGAIALARNGEYLSIADANRIERWDFATGRRTSLPNPAGIQALVALSADGERIARAAHTSIEVWRVGHDSVERRLERGHRESITALAFAADERRLASGGTDGTVRVWDLERGIATLTLRGPQDAVTSLEFSQNGQRLVGGGADGTVFMWDVASTPVRPAEQVEVKSASSCVGFSVEPTSMVVGSGATLSVRGTSNSIRTSAPPTSGDIRSCGTLRSGQIAFAVDSGGARLLVWDARTGDVRSRIAPLTDARSVRFSADGDVVAAYDGPKAFSVWDAMTGKRHATIEVDGTLDGPFELLDSGLVVAQVRNGQGSWVGAWDARTSRRLSRISMPHWAYGAQAAVCPAHRLVASTNGGDLRIVDLAAGTVKRHLVWRQGDSFFNDNEATSLAFSPDCSVLALGDLAGQITLWGIASGANPHTVAAHSGVQVVTWRDGRGFGIESRRNAEGVTTLAFSPDGRTLASGGGTVAGRGELKLWDASRGSLLATLPAESGRVTRVMFSASGRQLGVLLERGNQDSRGPTTLLDVWTARGPERTLLAADTTAITRLTFSLDGSYLVSEATTAKSWNMARNQLESISSASPPGEADATQRISMPGGDLEVVAREHLLYLERGTETPARLDSADEARRFNDEPIQSLHVMSDGTILSLGALGSVKDRPAEIILWDLASRRPVRHAFESPNMVTGLLVSPDKRTLVTVGSLGSGSRHPGFVHIWDAQRLALIAALPGHRALVTAAAISPDAKLLATGDANGFVRVWDLRKVSPFIGNNR